MAFTPRRTGSGKWQGGFRHPETKQRFTKSFDDYDEAAAWGIESEKEIRAAMILQRRKPEPLDVLQDQLRDHALLCAAAVCQGDTDSASHQAGLVTELQDLIMDRFRIEGSN